MSHHLRVPLALLACSFAVVCATQTRASEAHGQAAASDVVTQAQARMSALTHHGADIVSGLRITGRCRGGRIHLLVGHDPPYAPLRRTGTPSIDRTHPPRRAKRSVACRGGRFVLSSRRLEVRASSSPLRARTSTQRPPGLDVVIAQHAME